jgi:hypothetical protein
MSYGEQKANNQPGTDAHNLIRGATLLVLILAALMLASPVCEGQNGPKTQADGKQGSAFHRICDGFTTTTERTETTWAMTPGAENKCSGLSEREKFGSENYDYTAFLLQHGQKPSDSITQK